MQSVEVRPAVDAEQHGLTVEDERAVPVAQGGLGDSPKPAAPVVAVAGPQPHTLAVASAARNAGHERRFTHAGEIGRRSIKCDNRSAPACVNRTKVGGMIGQANKLAPACVNLMKVSLS